MWAIHSHYKTNKGHTYKFNSEVGMGMFVLSISRIVKWLSIGNEDRRHYKS